MIEVQNLTKRYGDRTAVSGISFTVAKGEILGFLGPNGAGKSTTMKMITGFLSPSEGKVTVGGYDMAEQPLEAKALIGYLPEVVPLYPDMSVSDYLSFVASLKGIPSGEIAERVDYVVKCCWLEEYRNRLISHLSKGYRQRVGLAQALIHKPPMLILDEPTSGLDPRQINETRELIRQLSGDHTVILSTHILPEVQNLCHRVLIINKGHEVAEDRPENLENKLKGNQTVVMEVSGPEAGVREALMAVTGIRHLTITPRTNLDAGILDIKAETDPTDTVRAGLASAIVGKGWDLLELRAARLSLEDIFIRLTTAEAPVAEQAPGSALSATAGS
jgi:ABC-2 type transport system ATP-binding protein